MGKTRAAGAAVLLLMLGGAPAGASTLKFYVDSSNPNPGWITVSAALYTAEPGETNALTVHRNEVTGMIVFKDPGARIRQVRGDKAAACVIVPRKEARCHADVLVVQADLGDGDDSFSISASGYETNVWGGEGADTLTSQDGEYNWLAGGPGNDTLASSAHGGALTYLHGDEGADTLDGGNSYGWLRGGPGADVLRGGVYADYGTYPNGVNVSLDGLANDGSPGEGDNVQSRAVWGSNFADVMTGESLDDVLYGNRGDDVIDAGAGADYLSGDLGDDQLTGGDGADHLTGGVGDDTLFAIDGFRDELLCGFHNDVAHADPNDVFGDGPCETIFGP